MTNEIPQGYTRVTEPLNCFSGLHLIDPKVLENAADRGTRAHQFCTLYAIDSLIVDVSDDCKGYVESFKKWFDHMVDYVVSPPERINSEIYKLSGEFDLIVHMKGDNKPTLIDIKTPANASLTWQLQTAAYAMLLRDHGMHVHRRIALMLPKNGSDAKVIEYTDQESDERRYLNALDLYRFFQ